MSSELSMTPGAIFMRELRKDPAYNEQWKKYWQQYVSTEKGWRTKSVVKLRVKARKFGLDFNIDKNDLIVPEFCPVLGIPLTLVRTSKRDDRPTVDRIDNSKGYIKGNVRVISGRANRIKSDATKEELQAILNYMSSQ